MRSSQKIDLIDKRENNQAAEKNKSIAIYKDLEKLAVKWLENKHNFLSINNNRNSFKQFIYKYSSLINESRIHFHDLEASPFYIKTGCIGGSDFFYERPFNHRHNFKNFNMTMIDLLYDTAKIKNDFLFFSLYSDQEKENIINDHMNALISESKNKRNLKIFLFQKEKKECKNDVFLNYSKLLYNFTPKIAYEFIDLLKEDKSLIQTYENDYINSSNKRKVEENGNNLYIFFPFKLDHDIWSNKNYLVEINKYKFQRANIDLKALVTKFYKQYKPNRIYSIKQLTLEDYFSYSGMTYKNHFAYFDPFKMLIAYNEKFSYLISGIKEKEEFIFILFDVFNNIQFHSILIQQENLVNAIALTKGTQEQKYTFKEFIKHKIKMMDDFENYESQKIFKNVLLKLDKKLKDLPTNFSKNTTLNDLGFRGYDDEENETAKYILDTYLFYCGIANIKYIADIWKKSFDEFIKMYKLNKKRVKIIYAIVDDLVTLYDTSKTKFSKPFNSTYDKIYKQKQKMNVDKALKLDEEIRFILKYNNKFENIQ